MPDPGWAGLGRAPALWARSVYVGRVQRLLADTAMSTPLSCLCILDPGQAGLERGVGVSRPFK
jgi:hypothetical protein